MKNKSALEKKLLYGAGVFFILALWKCASVFTSQSLILPSPEDVVLRLFSLMGERRFLLSLRATFLRVLLSLVITVPLGLFFGILCGVSKRVESFMSPLFAIAQSVPVISVILLAYLWLGSGKTPLFAVFLMVFPVFTLNIMEGIRTVDPKLKELFALYRIDRAETLRSLYLPHLTPFIAGGFRAALSMAWKVTAAAEVLVQPLWALGTGMQRAKISLETAELFAWTLACVIAAALCDLIFVTARKLYRKMRA